jgi:hypothetical protein
MKRPATGRLRCRPLALLAAGLVPLAVATGAQAQAAAPATDGPGATPLTDRTLERIETITAESQGLQRGINLARETATRLNGGLGLYRPASCMYAGISNNPCIVSRESSGFVFRFLGGAPGWEQFQLPATVESEIRISANGRSVEAVLYNGSPRQGGTNDANAGGAGAQPPSDGSAPQAPQGDTPAMN